jgi:hypothetical protein
MRSAGFCDISAISAGKNPRHPCSIFLSATDARMMYTGNQHSCIRGKKHLRLKTKPSKPPQPLNFFPIHASEFIFSDVS